jgi:hypothetical protein
MMDRTRAARRAPVWQLSLLLVGVLIFAGLIFAALGLPVPLAVTFGLLRRGRELLWVGFGLGVLLQTHALAWLRAVAGRELSPEPRAET